MPTKRKRTGTANQNKSRKGDTTLKPTITDDFISGCETHFNENPANVVIKDCVATVGSTLASTNQDELNKISFLFMNSVKKKNLKATDQGHSGTCWLFSALNTLRHLIIRAMDLEKFEFSETYLQFWDRFERCNLYIQWFIDNSDKNPGNRYFDYMNTEFMSDGGYWNFFANLIEKYGIIPKESFKDSFQSTATEDMNQTLNLYTNSAVNYIRKNKLTGLEAQRYKETVLKRIYTILVKYMGNPPKKFNWTFTKDEEVETVVDLDPMKFKKMVMVDLDMHDFVVVADMPSLPRNKLYVSECSTNIQGGESMTFLNLESEDLSSYTNKAILSGCAVWAGIDVTKNFNYYHSTLDDRVNNTDGLFGEYEPMTKAEALVLRNTAACHAVGLVGVSVDRSGKVPTAYQVENSWGFFDNQVEGMDGFLYLSQSWFEKYVMEIVVFKKLLSKKHQKMLNQTPVSLAPWSVGSAATKITGSEPPFNYAYNLKKYGRSRDN
jgi:bleomycin hydrolase